jgi:hypothetical protein
MTRDCQVDSATGGPEPLLAQLAGGVRLGEDRQVLVEVAGGDPVEVVAVMV